MRRVALTGGIATGKSHVRAEFERLGVPTIDADVLARAAVAPGTPGLSSVADRFGRQVLDSTGALDRRKLASIVFDDPAARRDLEAIIHPAVRAAIDSWFSSLAPDQRLAIADIPLLFEAGREHDFDVVILTSCDPATQIRRVMTRDGISESEARQRIAAQLSTAEKSSRADFVISTEGSFEDTNRQVRAVLAQIEGRDQ
ncbi:MAG TPA: dephospho-CoA kinase [Vicinamibacterales bacterium]|nr:dephospho-CoA kinase [Vicinamibacterales bacterium]